MATTLGRQPEHLLLTEAEVEEFRALAPNRASAELTLGDARAVAERLLRVLAIVRDVASGSNDSASSVDRQALPEQLNRANTTSPVA